FFLFFLPRLPMFTLFPYTTLFRSDLDAGGVRLFDREPRTVLIVLAKVRVATRDRCDMADLDLDRGAGGRGAGFLLGLGRLLAARSEEHTSELQSLRHLVCRLLLEK